MKLFSTAFTLFPTFPYFDHYITLIVKLRRGSGKDRQGIAPTAKGLKLKPEHRAYTKVVRHPPPTTTTTTWMSH